MKNKGQKGLNRSVLLYMLLTFGVSNYFSGSVQAEPLVHRVINKERLIRHRVGFIATSPASLSYALEIEKIILIQSSFAFYKMLDDGYNHLGLRFSWPGLTFESSIKDESLFRQVYGIGLGTLYKERFESPQRQLSYVQELLIPIAIDFDISYITKRSGFNFFGGLGLNIRAYDQSQISPSSSLKTIGRYSPFVELGLGYSF